MERISIEQLVEFLSQIKLAIGSAAGEVDVADFGDDVSDINGDVTVKTTIVRHPNQTVRSPDDKDG